MSDGTDEREGELSVCFPVSQRVTVTEDSKGHKVNKTVKFQLNYILY